MTYHIKKKHFSLVELMIAIVLSGAFATFGIEFFGGISKMNEITIVRKRFLSNATNVEQKLLHGLDRKSGLLHAPWSSIPEKILKKEIKYDYIDSTDKIDPEKRNQIRYINSELSIRPDGGAWTSIGDQDLEVTDFEYLRTFDSDGVALLEINILYKQTLGNDVEYFYEQSIRQPMPNVYYKE